MEHGALTVCHALCGMLGGVWFIDWLPCLCVGYTVEHGGLSGCHAFVWDIRWSVVHCLLAMPLCGILGGSWWIVWLTCLVLDIRWSVVHCLVVMPCVGY